MSTPAVCGPYCVGTVHVHPQSESLSEDLSMMGQSMMGMPGLLSEVAVRQDSEDQPLAERVVDHVYFGLMGMLTLSSAPVWGVGAGVAWAGEKFIEKLDVLHGMMVRVQQFGRSLSEQEAIIKEFGPLLDLSDKVADLTAKTEQKIAEVKQSTRELDELEANFKPHADLLERVSDMLSRLQTALTRRISNENITGLKELNLTARITVLKQIQDEERQMRLLSARLNGLIDRVGKKDEQLQQLEAQATQSTQVKGEQIAGLQRDVQSLNTQGDLPKVLHGNVVQVFA